MTGRPDSSQVERPLIDQLVAMGWKAQMGDLEHPSAAHRQSFSEIFLMEDLRQAILRINPNDEGSRWLDDRRLKQAISALKSLGHMELMEANRAATRSILKGTTVEGLPGWDGGQDRTVHFIDWDHPENNTFRVVNRFRVDEPSGDPGDYIVPDLVLFVNGIPLVVIECVSPTIVDPLGEALTQLQRYSNRRDGVEHDEGNERLFHYIQIMVATCFEKAVAGTVGSRTADYLEWKDTSPVPMDYVATSLGKKRLSSQEVLVAGMLRPDLLLDIIRNFTLFRAEAGKVLKIIPRYQQFRAVRLAVQRLHEGLTREEDGEADTRGGIIWHAQGSGKSLTMTFLIRKLRLHPELRRLKVVAFTNREEIQTQILDTGDLTGDTVQLCRRREHFMRVAAEKGPGLICTGIHPELENQPDRPGESDPTDREFSWEDLPVLNTDDSILLLVDEVGSLDAKPLQINLMSAFPNSARIGFTGTPIAIGAWRGALEVFGPFIDRYTVRQSENDGCTVPVLCESRTTVGIGGDDHDLHDVFEDLFLKHTSEELKAIGKRYATSGRVTEAPDLIAAKVRSMLRHYVEHVLPNGFKAQVVASSRRAAIRYHRAFETARTELVAELEGLDGGLQNLGEGEIDDLPRQTRFLVRAYPHLEVLRELESAPVIRGDPNDPPAWTNWTDPVQAAVHIARFQTPLGQDDPGKRDRLAFLFVDSMLLSGFNAPLAGVIYLDRHMKGRLLLQTIARVNLPYPKKQAGLVVDYYGMVNHLEEALGDYADEDIAGALRNLGDEIPSLHSRHLSLVALFASLGVNDTSDPEACIDALCDVHVRAEYHALLKRFLETLDLLLPRPEALPFVEDARTFAFIQARARNRYRDERALIGGEVGEKVRGLIDEHLVSLGIDPDALPPSILDSDFEERIQKEKSNRARALEMEHAIRSHLRHHAQEAPPYFKEIRDHLDELVTNLQGQWTELAGELAALVRELKAGPPKLDTRLDPGTEEPFLRILRKELRKQGAMPTEQMDALVPLTLELVDHIREEVRLLDFWRDFQKQDELRVRIMDLLGRTGLFARERVPALATRIMELARANPPRMVSS